MNRNGHLLEPPIVDWECRSCNYRDVTREARPHTRMHQCAGTGLVMPMIQAGQRQRVKLIEREDYVGKEMVTMDAGGRPIMSAVTERSDGSNDAVVYAPAAQWGRD